MSIKDITIVITSFKSDEIIRNCLNSIDRQYRIILVENSNNLELKKSIEREFTNVECILTGENFVYNKITNILNVSGNVKLFSIDDNITVFSDKAT